MGQPNPWPCLVQFPRWCTDEQVSRSKINCVLVPRGPTCSAENRLDWKHSERSGLRLQSNWRGYSAAIHRRFASGDGVPAPSKNPMFLLPYSVLSAFGVDVRPLLLCVVPNNLRLPQCCMDWLTCCIFSEHRLCLGRPGLN